jgi:hypothetical protein
LFRRANAAFLHSYFALRPLLRSRLDLPPLPRRFFLSVLVGKVETKVSNNILKAGEVQHLYIKLRNERQLALLSG